MFFMVQFKIGDLVGLKHPNRNKFLKIGIVLKDEKKHIVVNWVSYDKIFFMEKQADIFEELNNCMILGSHVISKPLTKKNLCLLSSI